MGDDANIAAVAHTLNSSRASCWLAMYVPALEVILRVAPFFDVGVVLPVSLGRINGRTKLGGWVEDLVTVLDSEAIDICESLDEMLLFALGSDGKAVDHVDELLVGKRSVVNNSAVG